MLLLFFFSSRRRHTRCALVTGFRRVLFRSPVRPPLPLSRLHAGRCDLHGHRRTNQPPVQCRIPPHPLWRLCARDAEGTGRQSAAYPAGTAGGALPMDARPGLRSEEHTSELQSLMRISYAVFCLKKKKKTTSKTDKNLQETQSQQL